MIDEHKSNTPANIKDLWQTPRELFDRLNKEFNFDTDVAASDLNHLCANYFTEENSGLLAEWGSVNFINPPFSNITPWVQWSKVQHELGKTNVMVLPSDTSVKWFKEAFDSCNEVRFISGRISFINADTQKPVNGNNKGSVLFIWRGHCKSHCVSLIDRSEYL